MLKVYKECCKNCLLSPNAIVSPKRRKQIIQSCVKEQTHFFCHKSTMEGREIVCKNFYDKLGHHSQLIRIAERLKAIQFVEQPSHEKLMTHKEMEGGK